MDLRELVATLPRAEQRGWRPERYELGRPGDREAFVEAIREGRVRAVADTLDRQLRELVREEHPDRRLDEVELRAKVAERLGGRPAEEYGAWFLYPWSGVLVHLLPAEAFRWLRTRRNRYKITAEEQARLARAKVGVIGLSVGRSAAITMALEGLAGELRIADLDRLELSNLNRLAASVGDLGQHKAVLAARALSEIDPYLAVRPFFEGVTADNLDAFLGRGDDRLDVLVEECDDLEMKLLVRARARELGIPVVMDTSDRGLLDVERFDLEPDRPLVHGLAGDVDPASLRGLSTAEKAPIVLRLVGGESISVRGAASLPEVGQTITGWPQLASDVALGGAVAAHVVRRILLGEGPGSGRYYVDVDEVLERPLLARPVALPSAADEERAAPDAAPRLARGGAHLGVDEIRRIVAYGVRAPSAHNGQPWRFRFADGVLECRGDPERGFEALDWEDGATFVAVGAAVENIVLAAGAMGFLAEVEPFPDPGDRWLAARVAFRFAPTRVPESAARWAPFLAERCTNRRRGPRRPLGEEAAEALVAAARPHGELILAASEGELAEIADLVGRSDRLTFLDERIHRGIMEGIRWTREEAERTRDGLDIMTMEFSAGEREAMRLLSRWSTMAMIKRIGGGRILENGRRAVSSASAVGLVRVPGVGPRSSFEGGRAMQRVWLEATRQGLAVTPLATLPYLFARLERGGGEGLDAGQRADLAGWRDRFRAVFGPNDGQTEAMMLRFARVDAPPTARSLRRPLDEVLEIAPEGA